MWSKILTNSIHNNDHTKLSYGSDYRTRYLKNGNLKKKNRDRKRDEDTGLVTSRFYYI